jgi:pSer/pThr/pTyr-binding forkhead associated (FHA) protein
LDPQPCLFCLEFCPTPVDHHLTINDLIRLTGYAILPSTASADVMGGKLRDGVGEPAKVKERMIGYPGLSGPALVVRHTGQVFPLKQATVVIGRQADCSIVLSDPQVSRQHAVVSWQAGTYVLQDLGSANGTYLNGRRITGPQPLRHGDTLRMGSTQVLVHLAPAAAVTQQSAAVSSFPEDHQRFPVLPVVIGLLVAGTLITCLVFAAIFLPPLLRGSKPTATIQAPSPDAQIVAGNEIVLQAMAAGARDITRLELYVDGSVVARTTSPDPKGMASLTARRPWTFDVVGSHVVSAIAHTSTETASAPASVEVVVVASAGRLTPTLITPPPSPTTPEAAPLQPTVPSPTLPPPTQPPGDNPTPTTTSTATPAPTTPPTLTPSPTATEFPPPRIEYFRANSENILVSGCATLEWGTVPNASEAVIDPGIGGVGTPGSQTVCPAETTTYVLTASGPGGTTTASATVTVSGVLPDLTVESITFDPSLPVRGQDTQVRITIRNAGPGMAGAFNWSWAAGSGADFGGWSGNLNPSETTVVTALWNPAAAHASLSTTARVDTDNEVPETNEGNNELSVTVQVVEPPFGDLVLQEFFLATDGQVLLRVSNPGGRIIAPRFNYDLYEENSLAKSGTEGTPPIGSQAFWTEYSPIGERTIRVVIDPEDLITEADEGNNELTLICSSATLSCRSP